jgi:hypothetical protein
MTNEELLQKILNNTIERIGRQAINYEAEIANLASQVMILTSQVEELSVLSNNKTKASSLKDS